MPSARPIIGVTGPDRGGAAAWYFTRFAVWLAGGHAVRITPRRPRDADTLDGLIVGGGADVDPTLYGQDHQPIAPGPRRPDEPWLLYVLEWVVFPLTWLARRLAGLFACGGMDAARDALEMRLIDQAVRRHLPVLGICRGEQLLNVYFGGSLHQSLAGAGLYVEDPETRTILPYKHVNVAVGTRLAQLLGPEPTRVNALHRQGVDRLGAGLRVAARDRNGIVQAVEHETLPFVLGVQWHPEYLPQLLEQRALFEALVREAKRAAGAAARLDAEQSSGDSRRPLRA
jgi:putative glutamine amidotransferase